METVCKQEQESLPVQCAAIMPIFEKIDMHRIGIDSK